MQGSSSGENKTEQPLPPVYQSSAFEQDTAADLEKIFENKAPGYLLHPV